MTSQYRAASGSSRPRASPWVIRVSADPSAVHSGTRIARRPGTREPMSGRVREAKSAPLRQIPCRVIIHKDPPPPPPRADVTVPGCRSGAGVLRPYSFRTRVSHARPTCVGRTRTRLLWTQQMDKWAPCPRHNSIQAVSNRDPPPNQLGPWGRPEHAGVHMYRAGAWGFCILRQPD